MTREELRDYVEEQRGLNTIPYHVYSALIDGIDTLCSEPILDKIKAEIEALSNANPSYWHSGYMLERNDVLEILDKYKAENEE